MNIAIIPARSGSKSIHEKNIKTLGGIPLIGWTIKAISNSKLIDTTIVSTDSEEFFNTAKSFNEKIILHKRSSELAEDVPTEFVLEDVLKKFNDSLKIDLIVLIQPTTPFISSKNIDECIEKIKQNQRMNTCVSVKVVTEYPEWMLFKKNSQTDVCTFNKIPLDSEVRQTLTKKWIPNGGIYVIRKEFFEKEKRCISSETLIYEMDKLHSIDIDEESDFLICEALVKSGTITYENTDN